MPRRSSVSRSPPPSPKRHETSPSVMWSFPKYSTLIVKEKPSVEFMKMMVDMNRDDEDVRKSMDSLEASIRLYSSSIPSARYEQKIFGGMGKIGRAFSGSHLQRMPSKVLNTIYHQSHLEIDIKSSYATMLYAAFDDLDLPSLKAYVDDAEKVYDGFRLHYGINRAEVKKIINAMICSFPNIPGDYGLGFGDLDRIRDVGMSEFVKGLKQDLSCITAKMRARYEELYDECDIKERERESDQHSRRTAGIAMSYLAADMEHAVMRSVIKKLYGDSEIDDIVWRFDGVYVNANKFSGESWDDVERDLSSYIMEQFNIKALFKVKSPSENKFAVSLSPAELVDQRGYGGWKMGFEKRFFRLDSPPVFVHVMPDSRLVLLNESQFKHNTCEEPKEFVKMWRSDPGKRKYVGIDFAPPPVMVKENYFNSWKGFAAAEWMTVSNDDVDIGIYLRHVDILMGNEDGSKPEVSQYFHKLIAQKFQYPGKKWRVMPFIRSTQGVGKDLWADFIGSIMGSRYFHKAADVGEVMGKSSCHQEGKLLIVFSEMSYQKNMEHKEELKNDITSEMKVIKQKYVAEYEIRHMADFVGFSNNFDALHIASGDRRMFVVTASGKYANEASYFHPLIEWMKQSSSKKAVYDYYMGMDITNFDSSADRVVTDDFKEMTANHRTPVESFMCRIIPLWKQEADYGGSPDFREAGPDMLRIKSTRLFGDFRTYAEEMKIRGSDSRSAMDKMAIRMIKELNSKAEKFLQPGSVALIGGNYKSNGIRFKDVDVAAWMRLKATWVCDDEEDANAMDGEERANAEMEEIRGGGGPVPKKTGHWNPDKTPRFVAREDGKTVGYADTFDDLNKMIGEPYVEQNEKGEWVLVNPERKLTILLDEYMTKDVDSMRAKVTSRYPWYVKDRTSVYR